MNHSKTKSIFHTFKKIRNHENSILEFAAKDDLLDHLIIALDNINITSSDAEKYLKLKKIVWFLSSLSGISLIIIGLLIIMLPIPNNWEIATLIYFNPNDGLTISDLIGLAIIFSGGYLIRKSLYCSSFCSPSSRK